METIKVNMTPCGFTPTIHASQGDGSDRKWAFDLYDENGKIDGADIKEQMIFDSRVGGTEQILPENGVSPVTAPIIADIQYPDGVRSEQEFLYRESPTTEDGKAKITRIQGNTLVWNQKTDSTVIGSKGTFRATVARNGTPTATITENRTSVNRSFGCATNLSETIPPNHVILLSLEITAISVANLSRVEFGLRSADASFTLFGSATSTGKIIGINRTANNDVDASIFVYTDVRTGSADYITVRNMMCFDLTQMFGSGNEPETVDEFTSLFSLPYYDYTSGKLLPFKGESLKTTGKNLFNPNITLGVLSTTIGAGINDVSASTRYAYSSIIDGKNGLAIEFTTSDLNYFTFVAVNMYNSDILVRREFLPTFATITDVRQFIVPENTYEKVRIIIGSSSTSYPPVPFIGQGMIVFGTSYADYEPYTENTINLPTLDYFPTGMKSVGSVYDELTESKAITRVGSGDLGTLTWYYDSTTLRFYTAETISDIKKPSSDSALPNAISSIYTAQTGNDAYSRRDNMIFGIGQNSRIYIRNTSYTDPSAFQTAMSGQYLFFELNAYNETDIATASLVTEKGEAPLYYDDGLIADCNETISSESGMFDAKIKLMTDETIYSQKIQLHIERKPQ